MTWGEVGPGDVLWWTCDKDELYLVLRRERARGGERLWLLCLVDGEVVDWPMVHPNSHLLLASGVSRLGV